MNKRDTALLSISETIVHDVPKHKRGEENAQVEYSTRESVLNDDLKLFFKGKVTEAVNLKGFKVVFDPATTSPVPDIIQCLIRQGDDSIVEPSKRVSKHLLDIQTGCNPPGIVVLIRGLVNGQRVIVIMKLERDEGARLRKDEELHFIDIESVRDLMLTKKTRLFKVGVFFDRTAFHADFDGYVCDNQISADSAPGMAKFFLNQFLGCQLYDDTRKLTREFYEATKDFIVHVENPIRRATYYEHLLSYMNRPGGAIDPREFAVTHFEEEDRHPYEEHLTRHNVQTTPFQKDVELVKTHITKMMIDFENDISIISRNGELGNRVSLTDEGGGITKAEIRSRIKKIDS